MYSFCCLICLSSFFFFQIKLKQLKEFPGLAMMFLTVEGKFLMVETIREGKLNCSFIRYLILENWSALWLLLCNKPQCFLFLKGLQKTKSSYCASIILYMAVTGKRFLSWLVEVLTLSRNALPSLIVVSLIQQAAFQNFHHCKFHV